MSDNNDDPVQVFTAGPLRRRVVQRGYDDEESFVDDDEPTLALDPAAIAEREPEPV
jgi:hypothetical protein